MPLRPPGPAPKTASLASPACGVAASPCAVGDALRLLSKAHVIDALHLLAQGRPLRFNELRGAIRVSANVLSMRLADLVEAGFVRRVDHGGLPPRVEYEATAAGRSLLAAAEPLRMWAAAQAPPARHPL